MKLRAFYILLFLLALQACKKSDLELDPPQTATGVALYFKGEINNKSILFEAGRNGYNMGNSWLTGQFPVWGSHFMSKNGNEDAISFFISNYSQIVDPDPEKDLRRTAVVGNKRYSTISGIMEDEAGISYRRNGLSYESALINQNGLDFQIQEVKDTIYQNAPFIIAKLRFNVLLYSFINKDTIEIKNGEARVAFKAKL